MTRQRLREVVQQIQHLTQERDDLIRDLHTHGTTVMDLTRDTGMTRPSIYKRLT